MAETSETTTDQLNLEALPNVDMMDPEDTISVEPTISTVEPSQHCPQRKQEEEVSFKMEKKRYTQQIQLLTTQLNMQCEQAQKNREKLGEEIRFLEAQVSELTDQLAHRDEQLHSYQESVQQLLAEKESSRLHYISLCHQSELRSAEFSQYIEECTKQNRQLWLQVQQFEAQLQHQLASVPPRLNKPQSRYLPPNDSGSTCLSTRTSKSPNYGSPSTGSLCLVVGIIVSMFI